MVGRSSDDRNARKSRTLRDGERQGVRKDRDILSTPGRSAAVPESGMQGQIKAAVSKRKTEIPDPVSSSGLFRFQIGSRLGILPFGGQYLVYENLV
jgi:hypothetical protein